MDTLKTNLEMKEANTDQEKSTNGNNKEDNTNQEKNMNGYDDENICLMIVL